MQGESIKGKILCFPSGHVLCDTCTIVTWLRQLGARAIMTNSAKAAYYTPTMSNVNATLAPLKECVQVALKA